MSQKIATVDFKWQDGPKQWTVIYLWDDNGQVSAEHVSADGASGAFDALCAEKGLGLEGATLIAAIEGKHQIHCPCEDSEQNVCSAIDYPVESIADYPIQ